MALQILQLLKMLPRTNCGDCGYQTCMAFATHVLREGEDPARCPHFAPDKLKLVQETLKHQEEAGITAFPEHFISAKQHVIDKIRDYDLAALAPFLGARCERRQGEEVLVLRLLNRLYAVGKQEVTALDGEEQDIWEHVLLYNYIAQACRRPLSGKWLAMGELPGALAKKKAFEEGCEDKIARAYTGRPAALRTALAGLEATFPAMETNAELHAVFYPLPRVPFLLLFWDADLEDGFPAKVKIMFDETVLCFLDIESLVFLGEKTADCLVAAS
ncbi:MAG: DUF3786 domain-containing protein [Deltaproteobacteria bacterium]|nr:DUF3786 domain-containing protein [Deltaproteobacteria bacterium]